MRKVAISITIILVIFIWILIYLTTRSMPIKATVIPGISLPAGSYSEHTSYYDIATNYPTTTPLTKTASGHALALIRNFIGKTIGQFKANFATSVQEHKSALQITYLIGSSKNTLSYIFTIYENIGAVHNMFFRTFVFNTATGQNLSLADLFLPGTQYLDTLSQISRTELPDVIGASMTNPATITNGTTPDGKNFSDFFFDNSDFVLLFPPYQVAPYAAGPQTLRIPLHELSNVLKSEY